MIMNYVVEYCDSKTGAMSIIDTIEFARADYTAEQYIEDCERNADKEWNDMLCKGIITLIPV